MAGWMIEELVGAEVEDESSGVAEEKGGVDGGGVDAAEEVDDGVSDFCGAIGDRRHGTGSMVCKGPVATAGQ